MPAFSASSLYEIAMTAVCTGQTKLQEAGENIVCALRHDFMWAGLHTANVPDDSNHLRAWREFRSLSQEELADKVGTTKSVISLLENEKRPLSSKWLRKLAEALDTQPGYILDHDPNEISADIFDIWSRIEEGDRDRAARILHTFTKTGTKD